MEDIIYKECNITILGEINIGKSSIIRRFCYNDITEYIYRKGPDSKEFIIDEKQKKGIDFIFRETYGQEKYRAFTEKFYYNIDIAVLAYDITRKETFQEIKNYWYGQVELYAPKYTSMY